MVEIDIQMEKMEKEKRILGFYSMPHLFTTFTTMKTIKATMRKVISATRKSPTANTCLLSVADRVDRFDRPGMAKPMSGITKSLTSA